MFASGFAIRPPSGETWCPVSATDDAARRCRGLAREMARLEAKERAATLRWGIVLVTPTALAMILGTVLDWAHGRLILDHRWRAEPRTFEQPSSKASRWRAPSIVTASGVRFPARVGARGTLLAPSDARPAGMMGEAEMAPIVDPVAGPIEIGRAHV